MNKEQLKNYLQEKFPSNAVSETFDFPVLFVSTSDLLKIAKQLKEEESTRFDFLFCETAVDRQDHFEMNYQLSSASLQHRMVLKVKLERTEMPEIDSVYELWKAADLFECEIFDLFGIKFINHPNLRRIFLGDEWKGFPLRKDYVDSVNVVPL